MHSAGGSLYRASLVGPLEEASLQIEDLQLELYGKEIIVKDELSGTTRSIRSRNSSTMSDDEA